MSPTPNLVGSCIGMLGPQLVELLWNIVTSLGVGASLEEIDQ